MLVLLSGVTSSIDCHMNNNKMKYSTIQVLLSFQQCSSFSPNLMLYQKIQYVPSNGLHMKSEKYISSNESHLSSSRRSFVNSILFKKIALITTANIITLSNLPSEVSAATTISQSEVIEISKQKLVKGNERLNYLLDHWIEETTICGRNDNPYVGKGGCERTPVKVMDYLGYKNMNDPLFRADKTMKSLESIIPNNQFNDYLDAIEKWNEAAEEGNGMAFISSWGEANPGGGKDRVELFIERARKNVIDSRDSIATIINILNIQ